MGKFAAGWIIFALALSCALPAAANDISSWSEQAGENNATPPNGWPANMQPNQVEPTAREMMAAVRRWYNHLGGTTTGGTPNAQTLTYAVAPQAYVVGNTYRFFVGTGLTNTGPTTINVNGLGAKAIVLEDGSTPLSGGELLDGRLVEATYDGASFRISGRADVIHGALLVQGGSLTVAGGDTFLDNNRALWFKDVAGTYRKALYHDGADFLWLGDTSGTAGIHFASNGAIHADLDAAGNLSATAQITAGTNIIAGAGGNVLAANTRGLWVKDAVGNYRIGVVRTAANHLQVGDINDATLDFFTGGALAASFDGSRRLNVNADIALNRHTIYLAGVGDGSHAIFNTGTVTDGEEFRFFNFLNLTQWNTTGTSRMFINNIGRVGINTTSPLQQLDVGGFINTSAGFMVGNTPLACGNLSNSANSCSIDATNASNIFSGTLPSGRLSGTYSGITGTGGLTVLGNVALSAGNFNFLAENTHGLFVKNTGGAYTGAITLDAGNNLLLGDPLNVGSIFFYNNGHEAGHFDGAAALFLKGSNIFMGDGTAGVRVVPSGQLFANNGGNWLEASADGNIRWQTTGSQGCLYNGGSGITCTSDANKKVGQPLKTGGVVPGVPSGRDKPMTTAIDSLKPISFQWKDPVSGAPKGPAHLGFNAQDVEQVFPQLVTTDENGMKYLDYSGLIAPLTLAVQELSARVSALEAKVP